MLTPTSARVFCAVSTLSSKEVAGWLETVMQGYRHARGRLEGAVEAGQRCRMALWLATCDVFQSRIHSSLVKFCRRLFAVALVVVLAGGVVATTVAGAVPLVDEVRRQGFVEIELRRTADHHLFVFGKVNGRQRSVLIDTGWSLTTVAKSAAAELRTPEALGIKCTESAFGTNEMPALVFMESLKHGRVALTNQPAVVRDLTFGGQSAPFDVVLGCDFLLRHGAVIDCENRRLYLRSSEPSVFEAEQFAATLRRDGFSPVAMQIIRRPLAMVCDAKLNHEPVKLLVDSAAVWSCVDLSYSQRLGLKLSPTPRRISGVGKTGVRGFAVTTLRSLSVGELEISDLNCAVFDLRAWGLAEPNTALAEVRGIFGGPELAAREAIIDCGGRTLWLKMSRVRK